jgi:hypothetical protein
MILYDLESRRKSRKNTKAKFVIFGVAALLIISLLAVISHHFYKIYKSGAFADEIVSDR